MRAFTLVKHPWDCIKFHHLLGQGQKKSGIAGMSGVILIIREDETF